MKIPRIVNEDIDIYFTFTNNTPIRININYVMNGRSVDHDKTRELLNWMGETNLCTRNFLNKRKRTQQYIVSIVIHDINAWNKLKREQKLKRILR